MNIKDIDDELKQNNISGIYFFYGDEEYDIERYVDKIKKSFIKLEKGVNFFEIDKNNIKDLEDACEGVSFFGEEKLILIKNTELKFNLDTLSSSSNDKLLIVITEKEIDKRTANFKALSKIAKTKEFTKQSEKDAAFFVIKTLGAYNIKVSQSVAEYMIAVCTENKQLLINEFRKIVAYLKPGDTLDIDTVDKLVVKTIDAKIFDLTDLLFKDQKEKALQMLDDLLSSKVYIVMIESLIFKQIRNVYQIKIAEGDAYYKDKDIAKIFGIHPYVFSKLKPVASKYTKEHLEDLILEMEKFDINSKTGKMDPVIGLKKIILSI